MTERLARATERLILAARRFVHGQRDENNVPVRLESLVFFVTTYECALAAEAREGQKEP